MGRGRMEVQAGMGAWGAAAAQKVRCSSCVCSFCAGAPHGVIDMLVLLVVTVCR